MGPHWVRSEGDHLALGAISTVSKVSFGEKTGKCWRSHGRWFPLVSLPCHASPPQQDSHGSRIDKGSSITASVTNVGTGRHGPDESPGPSRRPSPFL